MTPRIASLWLLLAVLAGGQAQAAPTRPECIAPAKPGGGFDLTCKLAQRALLDGQVIDAPMRVTYMPGGIGAVAYNSVIAQRASDPNSVVAFSSGSLLNLALGKYGKYGVNDVRWVASIGTDYGMIAVRADSPYRSLKALMSALRATPERIVFGAGGTIGSQDWMKSALVARQAGIDYRKMRYVAFEGGGEAFTALLGGHVQVVSGDIGEAAAQIDAKRVRILAVLADQRLPGKFAAIPTAREQGYALSWPIIRGFYVGPKVSQADYDWWVSAFRKAAAAPGFAALRESRGLFPLSLDGAELDAFVKKSVSDYQRQAREFDLVR